MRDCLYVGLDVHKSSITVALAESGRQGDVRHWRAISNRADAVRKLIEKLAKGGRELHFCYEAGPCGYGLYRQLKSLGQGCEVVAPSLIFGEGGRSPIAVTR